MTDTPTLPDDLPAGAVHLGTFTITGPGTFVGGVVKLWNDPAEDLLETAQSFLKAADRCLTGSKVEPGVEMLTVPGAVCAALACELYLKYMHLKKSGDPPHGHDLATLFGKLSETERAALIERRPDIEEVLVRNRGHLVDARYHHELAQFSFRQQELLQLAQALSAHVHDRHGPNA